MRNIRVDGNGTLHCANCGGTNFTEKRTFASKAVLGVGALLTSKKLKCQACGAYNQTGNAEPFVGRTAMVEDETDDTYVSTPEEVAQAMAEYDARAKYFTDSWESPEAYLKRLKKERKAQRRNEREA